MSALDPVGEQLAASGGAARLETRGRLSGRRRVTAVGFIDEATGGILIASGEPDADWARNLEANPRCHVTIGERSWDAIAEPLDRVEAGRAVSAMILKYGTPAERLGRGQAFRLRSASPRTEEPSGR